MLSLGVFSDWTHAFKGEGRSGVRQQPKFAAAPPPVTRLKIEPPPGLYKGPFHPVGKIVTSLAGSALWGRQAAIAAEMADNSN